MTNNDILRRLRYALNYNNSTLIEIFKLSGHEIGPFEVDNLLKKEEEDGYVECSGPVLELFLDGLVIYKRGRQDDRPGQVQQATALLTNNDILKKIRIALELKEEDMLSILKLADVGISKSELSALFRREGQKNYKACGDQFLRNFLQGLTIRYRGDRSPDIASADV
jgi:uncharacterized protein YehS (DUF1456 family)